MTKHKLAQLCFIGLWVILSTVFFRPTFAQSGSTTGTIIGTVKDQTGAIIVGATVAAYNLSTKIKYTIQANEQGVYFLSKLPPGEYDLTTYADGFGTTYGGKIILGLGTTAVLDVELSILGKDGDFFTEIVDSTLVNQGKTESSTNIDNKIISGLPINRRDFTAFSLTAARVTKDALPSQGVLNSSGLSINGQNARANNLTVDGLSNNEYGSGGSLSTFSQESVQEFQVLTDNFSAEIGRALAGAINIITKSGGNNFQASLFLFLRNDELSARNAFSPVNTNFEQYQFGSTFSGAIKREKAFFFSSFERLSARQNNIVTISETTIAAINRQGFFQKSGAIPFSVGNTSFLLKTDFILSSKNTLSLRYNNAKIYDGALEQFGGLVGDTRGGQLKAKDNTIAFNNIYLNNTLVNETRFIFTRRDRETVPISTQPQVQLIAPEGLVEIGQPIALPQMTKERVFQIVNNTTINKLNYNLKFGVDLFSIQTLPPTTLRQFQAGVYSFNPINFSDITGIAGLPSFTGLEAFDPSSRTLAQKAFLNFLATNPSNLFPGFPKNVPLGDLPLPLFYVQGFSNPNISISGKFFSSFIQNDIKFKSNLLIKQGLRYDFNRATSLTKTNGNFSPRVAFSYAPKFVNGLSIRGGYGVFVGVTFGAVGAFVQSFEKGLKTLALPFPFAVLPLQLAEKRFPITEELPKNVLFIPQLSNLGQIDPNFRNSYSQQANLSINYFLKNNTLFSAEYTFVRGIKILGTRNINPVVRALPTDILGSFISGRVDPSKGLIFNVESAYDSYYSAFTLGINQKVINKVTLLASYTYSKAIDNVNDFNPLLAETGDELNAASDRGLSLQDIRNRFVLSGVFNVGYSKSKFLKDFEISSIVTLETGKPYNLIAGTDLNLSGDSPPGDRPLGIGRNTGILPGFATVDLRLARKIKIKEKISIQTNLEVFNLFNKVNISEINRTFPPDEQGKFSLPKQEKGRFVAPRERFRGAFAPRQIQVGLKISF